MAVFSLFLGLISIPFLFIGLIPCFGWTNYIGTLPIAGLGGIIALYLYLKPENKSSTLVRLALIVNVLSFSVAIIRLLISGGFI